MIKLPPDITFVIQVVSFVLFWQLMKWMLFAPVQDALAARAARTSGDRERAEKLRTEAAALSAELDAKIAEARGEGMREAEEIRRRSEAEEQEILRRSREDGRLLLERERAITERQVRAVRVPLKADAERLAARVVAKMLGRPA